MLWAAVSLPMLEGCWCITVPPLHQPRVWPCSDQPTLCTRGSPWLPRVGAFSPAHHSPVPSAPLPWVPWSWGDMATQGTGADLKWERLANHTCGEEPLVPIITVAGGTWEVCPHSLQPSLPGDLPGGGHQSSGHILVVLAVGMKPDLPSSLPSAREVLCAGDVGACPHAGPSSPTGCSPPQQPGLRRLQSAATFYSWGFTGQGGGGLLLNRVCIFGAF